jgi:hypothetical protein
LAAVVIISRANLALDPVLPKNMPADSRFLPTGYDLDHNERQGTWVACQPSEYAGETFCRVTDAHGIVIFQGGFLPVRDSQSAPSAGSSTQPAKSPLRWVNGPFEGVPVPIIPMSDGTLLVPRDDRDALVDRWTQQSDEWQRLIAIQ